MATNPPPTNTQPQQNNTAAKYFAVILGAATAAQLAGALPDPTAPLRITGKLGDSAKLLSGLLGRFVHFTDAYIQQRYAGLPLPLSRAFIARERSFERIAFRNMRKRIRTDLAKMRQMDEDKRAVRFDQVVRREQLYMRLHTLALERRITKTLQHVSLRAQDPRSDTEGGALWLMDPTKKTHTPDCVAMHGRVWSWKVLRHINPANRHPGCGCRLEPSDETPINEPPVGAPRGWDVGSGRRHGRSSVPGFQQLLKAAR